MVVMFWIKAVMLVPLQKNETRVIKRSDIMRKQYLFDPPSVFNGSGGGRVVK